MNASEILIRPERPCDYSAIRDLIVDVFHETYGSGESEASLVEQLREQADVDVISLVASENETLIGQGFFSQVRLTDFGEVCVCVLGQVGLYAKWQRQGVGTHLIQEGLNKCKQHGYKAVFATGSLEYYSRFSFVPISETGLHTIFNSDHDMVLELEGGILDKVCGLVDYLKVWHAFIEE
jgi:putative acetyltransferase